MSIETITEFYNLGLWNKADLEQLVQAGVITQEQYNAIIGVSASAV